MPGQPHPKILFRMFGKQPVSVLDSIRLTPFAKDFAILTTTDYGEENIQTMQKLGFDVIPPTFTNQEAGKNSGAYLNSGLRYLKEKGETHALLMASGFQKSNPVFNREKLDWFNGDYIRKLSTEELIQKLNLENTAKNKSIVGLIQGRIKKLSDFNSLANFFFEKPELDKKLFGENYKLHLEKAIEGIEKERDLMEVVKENNFKTGDFFMDLRIAITGAKFTPPINESIAILGKEEALKRLCTILEPN